MNRYSWMAALLGLLLTGKHLSLGAMIGVILLMGLVTKNAILLVDGALQRLREGDDVDTALLKAGPRRLRPILMTSFAMAIGMVPTAVGGGMGSEFRSPMAIAVAAVFSAAVGIFFGFYPARKGARLDPIEALRFE